MSFLNTISQTDAFELWNWFTATTTLKGATTLHRRFFQYKSVEKPAMLWYRDIAKKSTAGPRKLIRPYKSLQPRGINGPLIWLTARRCQEETVALFLSVIIPKNSKVLFFVKHNCMYSWYIMYNIKWEWSRAAVQRGYCGVGCEISSCGVSRRSRSSTETRELCTEKQPLLSLTLRFYTHPRLFV